MVAGVVKNILRVDDCVMVLPERTLATLLRTVQDGQQSIYGV